MTKYKNELEITIDDDHQMAYVKVSSGTVSSSKSLYDNLVVVDLDESGNMVGFEILSMTRFTEFFGKNKKVQNDPISDFLPALVRHRLEALAM
jgi:uncharacterized protein YuzE